MSVWDEDPQDDSYCGGDTTHDPHGECPGMYDWNDDTPFVYDPGGWGKRRRPDPKPWQMWLRRNLRRVSVQRRFRGAWFNFEWHNYRDVRYIQVGVSDPYQHMWWATSITIWLSLGHGPNLLGWIPSKVYRYYGRK